MLSESVAQNPTIAVRPPKKYLRKGAPSGLDAGCAISSLTEACGQAQTISPTPTASSMGAASTSRCLMDSEPRITIQTFQTQKMKKPATSPLLPRLAQVSDSAENIKCTAIPPNIVWMPNQPQATSARISAGTFEPTMPKDERSRTGNGMPYLVPGKAFSVNGTRITTFATRMVHSASVTERPK